jgi:F-type H+-transporting ATPase subunit gamma
MAKARKILKRVKAVKSIRTVTKTMEMVASARFRRTHQRVAATKPYVDRLTTTVSELVSRGMIDGVEHPLLKAETSLKRDVLLVITSNRGLAGAYNSSVLRMAMERLRHLKADGNDVLVHVVGRRGIQFMKFRRQATEKIYTQFDRLPSYEQVKELADSLMARFTAGEISGLEVAYMQFISSGKQKPAIAKVMPLTDLVVNPASGAAPKGAATEFELIPSPGEILARLLPLCVRMKLFQCFLDAAVSEQIMRIAAMHSATDSADDMIHSLTVTYNRTRQGQITTELAEIMGGRVGLEE